jgi:hypothetical protein
MQQCEASFIDPFGTPGFRLPADRFRQLASSRTQAETEDTRALNCRGIRRPNVRLAAFARRQVVDDGNRRLRISANPPVPTAAPVAPRSCGRVDRDQ